MSKLAEQRNPLFLATLFVFQGICVGYYLIEVSVEVWWSGWIPHTVAEVFVTVVLVVSLAFTFRELRSTLHRIRHVESSLDMASGAFQKLLADRFDDWNLTQAEAEVAILTLKGFSIDEIAQLRKTATGTIRVQLSKIYNKSGASGRVQFVSLFIEELIDKPVSQTLQSKG